MVNIHSFPESSTEQNRGRRKNEKSSMSEYRPFGDNYHICLGLFLSSDGQALVWKWISSESHYRLRNIQEPRGAGEVLAGNMQFEGEEKREMDGGGGGCGGGGLPNF